MAEIIKETVVTQDTSDTVVIPATTVAATRQQSIAYSIYFFFGAIEVLLAFRMILKLLGASTASGFVRFIYSLSGIFILPFEGIFSRATAQGLETTSVFEPSTLVAMIVFAVLAWGIVQLVKLLSGEQQA